MKNAAQCRELSTAAENRNAKRASEEADKQLAHLEHEIDETIERGRLEHRYSDPLNEVARKRLTDGGFIVDNESVDEMPSFRISW